MGIVYKARDLKLDRDVAIKFLSRSDTGQAAGSRARFEVEARAAAALNHPNIATIHAIDEVDGDLFIVMEHIEGRTLDQIIETQQLDADRVLDLAIQIGKGLEAAHQRGVVHRDIKPSNIIVTNGWRAKVTDFGLARVGHGEQLTKSGTTIGTSAYMSPEQVRGERVDHRSDIWSFGVVLYEMVSGARPFTADHEHAVLHSILNDAPRPIPGTAPPRPEGFDSIVAKALEKPVAARYQQMTNILADLDDIQAAVASRSARSARQEPARPHLAVLPFASITGDTDMQFLGFALADQIIGALSYVKGVVVRPSLAVRKFQNANFDAATAGRELQVEFLLTGSYLKQGEVIRLTIEMIDIRSNEMAWRDSVEVKYGDVFQLQDLVSQKVLDGLKVRFSTTERQLMQADVPASPLAYEYYLRAIAYPPLIEDDRIAIAMLERAIALDPNYAPAFAEFGHRIEQISSYAMVGGEEPQKAIDAFRKALSLNPNHTLALCYLSFQHVHVGESVEAVELITRALRTSPNDAWAHFALSYVCRYMGMLDESAWALDRALELEPQNPRLRSGGFTFLYRGEYRRAAEVFRLDREGAMGLAWTGMSLHLAGDVDEALRYMDLAIAKEPQGFVGLRAAGVAAFVRGKREEALEFIRKLEQSNPTDTDCEPWYLIATAYGLIGDPVGCVRALKVAIEGGFSNYPCMARDPLLDCARGEGEFDQLLAIAKGKHEQFRDKAAMFLDRTTDIR